ncbi:hypothetical protein KC333_g54 [Hortaea werneckii]|nr:hypothetical protein KC333_g54 [Hortaea werneckii]
MRCHLHCSSVNAVVALHLVSSFSVGEDCRALKHTSFPRDSAVWSSVLCSGAASHEGSKASMPDAIRPPAEYPAAILEGSAFGTWDCSGSLSRRAPETLHLSPNLPKHPSSVLTHSSTMPTVPSPSTRESYEKGRASSFSPEAPCFHIQRWS